MTTNRDTLAYNSKAVITATGLTPDTLRAWERRYGVPSPRRSPGGHRLYSQRDVDMLRWLVERQHEGVSISRAIDLWKQLGEQGRDPLEATSVPTIPPQAAGPVVALRREWEEACLAFDEREAEAVLSRAFAFHPPEVVCLDVLQPGLAEIGERWYRGEVSIHQEHFASELAGRRIERLLAAAPTALRSDTILVACASEELHTFGTLLLSLLLRWRGWPIVFLGASVPLGRVDLTSSVTHPSLVVLSAQRLRTAANLLESARLLASLGRTVAFGGRIFNIAPSLRAKVPGFFLGEDLRQAVATAELLASTTPPSPDGEPSDPEYVQALEHFLDQRSRIEYDLGTRLADVGLTRAEVIAIDGNLAAEISAGLAFGNFDALESDLDWLGGLLVHRRIPLETLDRYLRAYQLAASTALDARGQPVLDWLRRLVESRDSENGSQRAKLGEDHE